jgi:hypothetical protein
MAPAGILHALGIKIINFSRASKAHTDYLGIRGKLVKIDRLLLLFCRKVLFFKDFFYDLFFILLLQFFVF